MLVNDAWYVCLANGAAAELLQYSMEELLGSDVDTLLPPRQRSRSGAVWPSSLARASGGALRIALELSVLRKDGTECKCNITVHTVPRLSKLLVHVVPVDPSSRVEALEAEVKAAQDAVHLRGVFLARMSHEIRTPLNGIVMCADLLKTTALSAEQAHMLQTILSCCDMTMAVISDILDFSKIDAGMLVLEEVPFSIAHLVDEVADVFRAIAASKSVELKSSIDPALHGDLVGDRNRVRQVLLNLVSNAVKFVTHGVVEIAASQVALTSEEAHRPAILADESLFIKVAVRVMDSGIGMNAATVSRLFQPFVQADASTTRMHGGSGLGLVIAHRLAAVMGGGISVTSSVGVGSTFTASLILKRCAQGTPSRSPRPGGPRRRRRRARARARRAAACRGSPARSSSRTTRT